MNPTRISKIVAAVLLALAMLAMAQDQLVSMNSCQACAPGFGCCNDQRFGPHCFEEGRYNCLNGNLLCPVGNQACGSLCYNTIAHQCLNGVLCGRSDAVCNGQCYSPALFSCMNGILCGRNEQACGDRCYDPSAYRCENGQIVQASNQ